MPKSVKDRVEEFISSKFDLYKIVANCFDEPKSEEDIRCMTEEDIRGILNPRIARAHPDHNGAREVS
jgi:hypothetical protein